MSRYPDDGLDDEDFDRPLDEGGEMPACVVCERLADSVCSSCRCDLCPECGVDCGDGRVLCTECDARDDRSFWDDDYDADDYPADAEDAHFAALDGRDVFHLPIDHDWQMGAREADPWTAGGLGDWTRPAFRATWRKRRTALNHLARRKRRRAKRFSALARPGVAYAVYFPPLTATITRARIDGVDVDPATLAESVAKLASG